MSQQHRPIRARAAAGFTLTELVVVLVVTGILGALAISRFFDNSTFETREYADQARTVMRYAQKLAIAQNRPVYVSATSNRFAACFTSNCSSTVVAPAGSNSGNTVTRAVCVQGVNYVSNWMCEGKPGSVTLTSSRATEAGGANSYFFFDAMGRPYNAADAAPPAGYTSTFGLLTLTFSGNGNSYTVLVEPETGYVH